MELTFLGTSSMVPTKERNHTSIYLNYDGEGILFDCGEGTQRQIKIAGIKPSSIKKLFISHWHGDHVLGIPGLIETLGHNDYTETLEIYGPKGTERSIKSMLNFFSSIAKIKYKVTEMETGSVMDEKKYIINSYVLNHVVPCIGFSFIEKDRRRINTAFIKKKGIPDGPLLGKLQRGNNIIWNKETIKVEDATKIVKGKKIGFVFDTKLTNNCYKIAENNDLLISESTFTDKHKENAEKYKHLTASQAATIAKESNAKKLYLTHFSQRINDMKEIKKESLSIFKNTHIAEDFMKIKI